MEEYSKTPLPPLPDIGPSFSVVTACRPELALLLVTCIPVQPVTCSGSRRLKRFPRQLVVVGEGGATPSRTKNKTCQSVDEFFTSQRPSCRPN